MHGTDSATDRQPPLDPDLLADNRVQTTDTGYRVEAFDGDWVIDPAEDGRWVAQAAHSSRVSHADVNALVRAILIGETLR
jgi:hypothetical protein